MASFVNAIAGGGTFIAFPTLTGVIGLTEKLANATCTVGLWPGYASSVAAARDDLAAIERNALTTLILLSLGGGAVGGALLLVTPDAKFRIVVPILLGIGTMLFAAGPIINRRFNPEAVPETPQGAALPVIFIVAIYNGYFGAGGGVLVMAGLALCGLHDARRANIFKMLVQVTSNAAAVVRDCLGSCPRHDARCYRRRMVRDAPRQGDAARNPALHHHCLRSHAHHRVHRQALPLTRATSLWTAPPARSSPLRCGRLYSRAR